MYCKSSIDFNTIVGIQINYYHVNWMLRWVYNPTFMAYDRLHCFN